MQVRGRNAANLICGPTLLDGIKGLNEHDSEILLESSGFWEIAAGDVAESLRELPESVNMLAIGKNFLNDLETAEDALTIFSNLNESISVLNLGKADIGEQSDELLELILLAQQETTVKKLDLSCNALNLKGAKALEKCFSRLFACGVIDLDLSGNSLYTMLSPCLFVSLSKKENWDSFFTMLKNLSEGGVRIVNLKDNGFDQLQDKSRIRFIERLSDTGLDVELGDDLMSDFFKYRQVQSRCSTTTIDYDSSVNEYTPLLEGYVSVTDMWSKVEDNISSSEDIKENIFRN